MNKPVVPGGVHAYTNKTSLTVCLLSFCFVRAIVHYESCNLPISTIPGPMKSGPTGASYAWNLFRGMSFNVSSVDELLSFGWYVSSAAAFRV